MARYFCHFTRDGILYEDASGFDAADDSDATNVVRVIAVVLLRQDSTSDTTSVTVQSGTGGVVITSTIGELASSLQ